VAAARDVTVYGHPGTVWPRYAIRDGVCRAIHMPHASMAAIDALPSERMHWVSQPVRLWEAFGLTGPIPRKTPFEDPGGPFFLDPEGRRPDAIDDDLALWVETARGVVVCVGCCHAGVVNTLSHVQELNPGARIRALIGGFHLVNASRRRLDQTVAVLRDLDIELLVPCHCTGDDAVKTLTDALGPRRLSPGAAGNTYRF
jgi:7,8-dihydropterin-6-yl-methyl-4-(beta-D-ribofuranosyl)aminobenzene 5'-phosphate synthase